MSARLRRFLLGSLFFVFFTAVLSGQTSFFRTEITVGRVATDNLLAPDRFINRYATEERRRQAEASIPLQLKSDDQVGTMAEDAVRAAFDGIPTVISLPNQDIKAKAQLLRSRLNLSGAVSADIFEAVVTADETSLRAARLDALQLAGVVFGGHIRQEDVEAVKQAIDREGPFGEKTPKFTFTVNDSRLKTFGKELVKSLVVPNEVPDPAGTAKRKEEARKAVDPNYWQKGQAILKANELVTEEQYEALKDLGIIGARASVSTLIGMALLTLIALALEAVYLIRFRRDLWESDSKLVLLGAISMATLLLSVVISSFNKDLAPHLSYLMPLAVNAILITILVDPKVALVQSLLLNLLVGLSTGGVSSALPMLAPLAVGMVGSIVGVYTVPRVESRTDIYRAGLYVSAVNALTILAIKFTQTPVQGFWKDAGIDMGLGAFNGMIVAVVVTGALPFFENLFGIVTPLRLLELSNPNHPLLKKLLVEAPGSYHHTIVVANLCEAAAEAIGADPVLARVGAYYHDIGKTRRPYFFVENQMGGENPHDKLPPSLSAMIITNHVKDGIEMAKEARLPQEIADFIPEHHGTMLVSYFYHMASKSGQSEYILEEDFRYDGPKPRRKETAVCMLADGCEAAVRAMRQKGQVTIDQIEGLVKSIIADRLKQGQLENCDLTFRDLSSITKIFVKLLGSVHHARIEYPPEALLASGGAPAQEEKRDADMDRQRPGEDSTDGESGGDDSQSSGGRTPVGRG